MLSAKHYVSGEGVSEEAPFLGVEESFSFRRWVSREFNEEEALAIARRHNLPDILARVLAARGVTEHSCGDYLSPNLRRLMPDPSCLVDMDKAVARMVAAIKGSETIAIFGDYDVDGATSSALIVRYLRTLGCESLLRIPDRLQDGYGPTTGSLLGLAEQGASLVVTVDCGATAYEPLSAASQKGLDVVVLDHHLPSGPPPEAFAVVNPRRDDDESGQDMLAAVGVTFLFLAGVNRALRKDNFFSDDIPEPDLMNVLDLVALGTICDVMPLTGVNRAFVVRGLRIMERFDNAGLAALAAAARMEGAPEVYHAGFILGPRINAGGRVGHSSLGARLLASDDREEVTGLAERLEHCNKTRQGIEADVTAAAIAMVEAKQRTAGRNEKPAVIIAAGEGWHPGVIGIVAGRLKERYQRPALVISVGEDGEATGSGRSISAFNMGAAIGEAVDQEVLIKGGGHAMAAGFTLHCDRLDDLEGFLNNKAADQGVDAQSTSGFVIDGLLAPRAVSRNLYEQIRRGAPYGPGCPEPCFALASVRPVGGRIVGEDHVSCVLAGEDGARVRAIAFRSAGMALGDALLGLSAFPVHAAGVLRADDWGDRRGVQFHIRDVAPAI